MFPPKEKWDTERLLPKDRQRLRLEETGAELAAGVEQDGGHGDGHQDEDLHLETVVEELAAGVEQDGGQSKNFSIICG